MPGVLFKDFRWEFSLFPGLECLLTSWAWFFWSGFNVPMCSHSPNLLQRLYRLASFVLLGMFLPVCTLWVVLDDAAHGCTKVQTALLFAFRLTMESVSQEKGQPKTHCGQKTEQCRTGHGLVWTHTHTYIQRPQDFLKVSLVIRSFASFCQKHKITSLGDAAPK